MNYKNILRQTILFLFATLFLWSCVADDFQNYSSNNQENKKTYIIKSVSFQEIENKKAVRQKIERFFQKNNSQNYLSKSSTNNKNYILNTENIAYIEDGVTHSYTMQIIDVSEPYKFINLLLSSSDGENYNMYMVDYYLSEDEKLQYEATQPSQLIWKRNLYLTPTYHDCDNIDESDFKIPANLVLTKITNP